MSCFFIIELAGVYGSVIDRITNFCLLNEKNIKSFIKMLNRIGPKIEPCRTPLKFQGKN